MRHFRVASVICIVLLAPLSGFAERAPEDRTDATHVTIGKVEGVYVREDKSFHQYVVEITVEKTSKGDGLAAGTLLYARCYRWNSAFHKDKTEAERKRALLSYSSYDGVPKAGERVRVYLKRQGGKYVGVYPSWYDVLEAK